MKQKNIETIRHKQNRSHTNVRLAQAPDRTETYSISPYVVTDSSTIVHIARQLYTYSKNVSLLCFLHKGRASLFLSWQIQPLATTNREKLKSNRQKIKETKLWYSEGLKNRAAMKQSCADKRVSHKNNQRKQEQENNNGKTVKI